jgi:hypothetical protein
MSDTWPISGKDLEQKILNSNFNSTKMIKVIVFLDLIKSINQNKNSKFLIILTLM